LNICISTDRNDIGAIVKGKEAESKRSHF
jgi:hypothetical protein